MKIYASTLLITFLASSAGCGTTHVNKGAKTTAWRSITAPAGFEMTAAPQPTTAPTPTPRLVAAEPVATPPATPPASAPTRGEIVAVFDLQDGGGALTPKAIDQLTDYLAVRIAQVRGYRVIPRQQLRDRLSEEKSASYQACVDETCQIELGKALAAEKSLVTKLIRVGDKCAVTASVYDLKTEASERAASTRTECDESALLGGIDAIIEQLRYEEPVALTRALEIEALPAPSGDDVLSERRLAASPRTERHDDGIRAQRYL